MTVQADKFSPIFEKQDDQALNKNWMTGFSNKDYLASLTQDLAETKAHLEALDLPWKGLASLKSNQTHRLALLDRLL